MFAPSAHAGRAKHIHFELAEQKAILLPELKTRPGNVPICMKQPCGLEETEISVAVLTVSGSPKLIAAALHVATSPIKPLPSAPTLQNLLNCSSPINIG